MITPFGRYKNGVFIWLTIYLKGFISYYPYNYECGIIDICQFSLMVKQITRND